MVGVAGMSCACEGWGGDENDEHDENWGIGRRVVEGLTGASVINELNNF